MCLYIGYYSVFWLELKEMRYKLVASENNNLKTRLCKHAVSKCAAILELFSMLINPIELGCFERLKFCLPQKRP